MFLVYGTKICILTQHKQIVTEDRKLGLDRHRNAWSPDVIAWESDSSCGILLQQRRVILLVLRRRLHHMQHMTSIMPAMLPDPFCLPVLFMLSFAQTFIRRELSYDDPRPRHISCLHQSSIPSWEYLRVHRQIMSTLKQNARVKPFLPCRVLSLSNPIPCQCLCQQPQGQGVG